MRWGVRWLVQLKWSWKCASTVRNSARSRNQHTFATRTCCVINGQAEQVELECLRWSVLMFSFCNFSPVCRIISSNYNHWKDTKASKCQNVSKIGRGWWVKIALLMMQIAVPFYYTSTVPSSSNCDMEKRVSPPKAIVDSSPLLINKNRECEYETTMTFHTLNKCVETFSNAN